MKANFSYLGLGHPPGVAEERGSRGRPVDARNGPAWVVNLLGVESARTAGTGAC